MKRLTPLSPITLFGLAFWWPFLRNSITGYILADHHGLPVFLCMALVCCLIYWRIRLDATAMKVLVPSVCGLSSLGNLSVILLPDATICTYVAAVAFAASYVLLPMAWASHLHDRFTNDGRRMLFVLLASYALSFIVGYLSYLPTPLSLIRPVGAPAISGFCWLACRAKTPSHRCVPFSNRPLIPREASKRRFRQLYIATLSLFLLSSVPLAFVDGGTLLYEPSSLTLTRDTLNLVLIGLLLAMATLSRRFIQARLALLLAFSSFSLIGIAIASAFSANWFAIGVGVMATGKSSLALLLFAVVCLEGAPRSSLEQRVTLLFVVPTVASTFLHSVAIPALCDAWGFSVEGFWGISSLLVAGALSVCLLALLSIIAIRSDSSAPTNEPSLDESARLATRAARQLALSTRETEVLELVLKGNTFKKIGEVMHLSDSTIQSHSKSIYRKAGVHTKQELVDLVRAIGEGDAMQG